MEARQWEQCLATLLQLKSEVPRHPQVLKMLANCYEQLRDWQALIDLLPGISKAGVLDADALAGLQQRAWSNRLSSSTEDPADAWRQVPKDLKRDSALVANYVRALLARNAAGEAEAVVRTTLDHIWQSELVQLYGEIVSDDTQHQLVVAERWLKARPNDAVLLLTLGRICLMNHLWAKAREYLEASLRLRRTPEVYGELGRLCTALGDVERGGEYLGQSLPSLPDLPLPERTTHAAS